MNKQEITSINQNIDLIDYTSSKFLSVDLVKLHLDHKPLTKEDIGLKDKLCRTPPKAPRLR